MSAAAASPAKAPKEPKEPKEKKEKKPKGGAMDIPKHDPTFVAKRNEVWDRCMAKQKAAQKGLIDANKAITITLPDGKTVPGVAGVTTPLNIAEGISSQMAKRMVISKVNGEIYDLHRPILCDAKLELFSFDSKEGAATYWHSSAHVLGQALEQMFDAKLCVGPPLDDGGFYYDVHMEGAITKEHYESLEKIINDFNKAKHEFIRLELSKKDALEMFAYNPFKVEIISTKVPDGETCTVYRCGNLIDLCRGPHVPNTGKISAMQITNNSASYWLAKQENASLQRVYGISFPDKKQLTAHMENLALAAERDHRKLGTDQKLFFFHQLSPGSPFILPHGTRIYNKLLNLMRKCYLVRGFEEVTTPNAFNVNLWKTSGHYQNYAENMFLFEVEKEEWAMKPMNCPGHCLMFGHTLRSYKELPIRYADFGVLHRNELSGALTGLTRVRRFCQDDAHIFCRPDQIEEEVGGALDFLNHVYSIFGFKFTVELSTRPAKFLGEIETWDNAEAALAACLNSFGKPWKVNPADGAFYGPKIDIQLTDALNRKHQCATIQLDFQLPIRFGLEYKTNVAGVFERPVIIHRAILGSIERMMAVLLEHTGGKWPFWLSPRQVVIVPIFHTEELDAYCKSVQDRIAKEGYYVDYDNSDNQFKKKVRDAQISQYNYILVVGAAEAEADSVNLRFRDTPEQQTLISMTDLMVQMKKACDEYK